MAQIDTILEQFVARNGSDLHLSPGRRPTIRVNGDLEPLELPTLDSPAVWQCLQEIMPETNRLEFEAHNDTAFVYDKSGSGRFRANVFRDLDGPGGVFRWIPAKVPSAEELHLPKAITELCLLGRGLVVVTGPDGSGKSTTLAAMIDYINRTRVAHIITIEDPVEFVHRDDKSLINQREIRSHTSSLAAALHAALREDPDVLLTGEMRDPETIEIMLHAAESGHLVFGTLHASTAANTVDWIIDAFPADRQKRIRAMLASALKGVVAQTLCKRRSAGRVAAREILILSHGGATMIREGKSFQIPAAMQVGGAQGTILLNDVLAQLVCDGVVDPQHACGRSPDQDELCVKIKRMGYAPTRVAVASEPPAKAPLRGPEAVNREQPAVTATAAESAAPATAAPPAAAPPAAATATAAPDNGGPKISSRLTIGGESFLCCPWKEAVPPEEGSVYVILAVDQWGSWTVLEVGQTDAVGEQGLAAEREGLWAAKCPSKSLWIGLHAMRGPMPAHRVVVEGRICAEHKLPRRADGAIRRDK